MLQVAHSAQSRLSGTSFGKCQSQRSLLIAQAGQKHANAALSDATDASAASNGASNPLDFDELTEIIKMVHDTDIVEFELKSKKFSLAVRKKEAVEKPEPIYQQMPQAIAPAPQQSPVPQPQAAAPPSPPSQQQTPSAPQPAQSSNGSSSTGNTVEVASPMSGTFYHAPAPGEPAFVKIGDKVTKGQTIGIIEAMKLMNEIEADSAGTIVEFTAENASSVTPGQSLVRIQP